MRRRKATGSTVRTFSPSTLMLPLSASISRLASRSSVVLPEPEPPTMARNSPSATSSDTSSTAKTRSTPRPASGTVKIFDAPLTGLNREAGYLFQADALFPWKTALDNVAIGLEIQGAPRAMALERAQGWLTSVGLGAFANRYPHMLSGGQRKRVGLAQVLIRDPKILLMDEPFGPLDAQTRQIMGNLLLELWNADRKAVLFVTHDLDEAIALADRVVIMSAGPSARIIGDWPMTP